MNKNKYILLGAVVLGLGLTSCSDFLNVDRYFRDQQSTERIFSDKDYTLQWLSFCYSRLQGDNLEVGHSDVCPFNFSDDQVFNERGDRFAKFKRGEYLNSTGGQNAWKWSYDGIYQASILLNELYENEDLTPEEVTDVREADEQHENPVCPKSYPYMAGGKNQMRELRICAYEYLQSLRQAIPSLYETAG